MKLYLASVLILASTAPGWAQVPPNDEFTNRIPVVGSSFTITASTAGATFDHYNEPGYSSQPNRPGDDDPMAGNPSLWWSWTPTQSATVFVERAGNESSVRGYLIVFATTNLSYDSQYDQVAGIYLPNHGQYDVFRVQAGKEYQIVVASYQPVPLSFRFESTEAPVFRLHPRTRTVTAGQSVLFGSYAVGVKPLSFQWQKNGVSILNATNQMLAIDNCSPDNIGGYAMVATSATGVSTSGVARLFVVTNEAPAALTAIGKRGTNQFEFRISGEEGRDYRVEYSSDLASWGWPWGAGLLQNSNLTTVFQISMDLSTKFLRVSPYRARNEVCVNNLRQLRAAIWLFAQDWHLNGTYPVTQEDLAHYVPNGIKTSCPDGPPDYMRGSYAMIDVDTAALCMIDWQNHVLEEP